jgi:hypothetical protein
MGADTPRDVQPGSPTEVAGAGTQPEVRDAVIWVSGLSETALEKTLPEVATRLAVAMDNATQDSPTRFSVSTPTSEHPDHGSVPFCTIDRADSADSAESRPVVDVYGVSVEDQLVGPVRALPLWKQAIYGGSVVLAAGAVLLKRLRQNLGKSPRERWQILYAIGLVILMAVAFVLIVGAFVASLTTDDLLGVGLPQWAAAGIVAVGGFGLWKSPWAKKLRAAGLTVYAMYRYIERADKSGAALQGNLARVLDSVETGPGSTKYEKIAVIAYSFGSLVALDACFSPTATPPQRLASIDELVTVGCPYDCLRAFRPDYAGTRYWREDVPGQWMNVYAPSDVLSSNFRNDDTPGEADVPVPLRDYPGGGRCPGGRCPENLIYRIDGRDQPVGPFETVLLRGLAFHGRYWDEADPNAVSVFGEIVRQVFSGRPVLV